jgi:hypothetical protein
VNAKKLTLALAALALCSSSAAQAQILYGYGGLGSPTILNQAAVVGGNAIVGNGALLGNGLIGAGCANACGPVGCDIPLFGRRTWFDNRFGAGALGMGYGIGNRGLFGGGGLLGLGLGRRYGYGLGRGYGYGLGNNLAYGGLGYGGLGCGTCGVNTLSAVLPNACGAQIAAPVCGQRRANAAVDLRLFRFGFGFGTVSPRWDNRPAGWSF